MRLTLVTETFAPQVNGVSRTLGQLVKHLESCGDEVQVVHPDYGKPAAGPLHHLVPSHPLLFYREVGVPLPPFGAVHLVRDRRLRARPDPRRHRGDPRPERPAARPPAAGAGRLQFPHQLRPVLRPLPPGMGRRGSPALSSVGSTPGPGEIDVPSSGDAFVASWRPAALERLVRWPRVGGRDLFRPDRPGRAKVREVLGFGPDDVVIGHAELAGGREERDAPGRAPSARPGEALALAFDVLCRRRRRPGPIRLPGGARWARRTRFVGHRYVARRLFYGDDPADHYTRRPAPARPSPARPKSVRSNVVLEGALGLGPARGRPPIRPAGSARSATGRRRGRNS